MDAFCSHWRYRGLMSRGVRLCAWLLLGCAVPHPAQGADPRDTVRAFCQADGRGDRLLARTWPRVAPLIAWALEPAWDRVTLIAGYEVAPARVEQDGALVEVTYAVDADVGPGRISREQRRESRTFHLALDDTETRWVILGPPPRPHVFGTQVDADAMAASLDPQQDAFLSASALVWQLMKGAGSDAPYLPTAQLAAGDALVSVTTPEPGDLIVYYDGDEPYHVGVLEAEDIVVSATLNAGIRRAPVAAFAGTPRYRRVGPTKSATPAASPKPRVVKRPQHPRKAPTAAPKKAPNRSRTGPGATQRTPPR